jgi:hypothetical protein
MATLSINGKRQTKEGGYWIACIVAVVSWHFIFLAALMSGKGFLSNLHLVWGTLFLLLPLFSALVFGIAAFRAFFGNVFGWRLGALALISFSPVLSFFAFQS